MVKQYIIPKDDYCLELGWYSVQYEKSRLWFLPMALLSLGCGVPFAFIEVTISGKVPGQPL